MCGIVGYVTAYNNGFSNAEADAFRDMVFVDTMRGWDSTGVFGVDKQGNVLIHKKAVSGPNFIRHPEMRDFLLKGVQCGQIMVGHNRAATRGSIKDENAHPFWVKDKIILVQNGTYRGSHKHLKDTEVDTEAITHVLAEEDDVEAALQRINAAYALVWYNTEKKELNLIRNNERPLYVCDTKAGGIMFASEMETIFWAATRNKVDLKEVPKMLEPSVLTTIKLHKSHHEVVERKLDATFRWPATVITSTPADCASEGGVHPLANRLGYPGDDELDEYWAAQATSQQQQQIEADAARHIRDIARGGPSRHSFHDEPRAEKERQSTRPFPNIIFQMLDEFHGSEEQGKANTARLNHIAHSANQEVIVELHDYIAANGEKGCVIFHVYGTILGADESKTAEPVIHWMLSGVDEATALDYVTNGMYKVKIGTPIKHTFLNNDNVRKTVVSAYGFSPERIVNVSAQSLHH